MERDDLLSVVRGVDALVDVVVGPASKKNFWRRCEFTYGGLFTTYRCGGGRFTPHSFGLVAERVKRMDRDGLLSVVRGVNAVVDAEFGLLSKKTVMAPA